MKKPKVAYAFDSVNHIHSNLGKALDGCTTVLDIIGKELTWWASGMACAEFGWLHKDKADEDKRLEHARDTLARIKGMGLEEYMVLLDKAYRAHHDNKEKAAVEGIDLHAEIEAYIVSKIAGTRYLHRDEAIKPFELWAEGNVKKFLFAEAHCLSTRLGTGGVIDFGYLNQDNGLMIGDIKRAKDFYFNHFAQTGGYGLMALEHGLFDENGKALPVKLPKSIAGHAIFALGKPKWSEPAISYNVSRNESAFEFALGLYRDSKSWKLEFGKR